jgi:hypothetical protein
MQRPSTPFQTCLATRSAAREADREDGAARCRRGHAEHPDMAAFARAAGMNLKSVVDELEADSRKMNATTDDSTTRDDFVV